MKTISTIVISAVILISLFAGNPAFPQWTQVATPEGAGVTDMVVAPNGNLIVTCASFGFPTGKGGVRVSTDNGASWVSKLQHYTARTLALGQDGYVFASSWDYPTFSSEGLYVSTNGGLNWPTYNFIVGAGNNIFSIHVTDNNQTVYIGTRTGVMKSTNGGINFVTVNSGIPANSWVRDITASSTGILFAATTNGLFKSTNSGGSWSAITGIADGDTVICVKMLKFPGDSDQEKLSVGTDNGKVYMSPNSDYAAVAVAAIFNADIDVSFLGMVSATDLLVSLFPKTPAAAPDAGVKKSPIGALNFSFINDGFPPGAAYVSSMAVSKIDTNDTKLFAGFYQNQNGGAKVFMRTFSVGVNQISSEVPKGFELSQNYPNPFNPSTKIKFALPQGSFVKLVVYDALGKEMETLVNKQLSTGSYEADWNAARYTSGVYFYTLTANGLADTKKMLLVK
jgi:photosystem II stability/assembly factor-like uncharacterized protein